jgi:hypothetical protein
MRLNELVTDEADLPLIYDLIRAKLAAGLTIYKDYHDLHSAKLLACKSEVRTPPEHPALWITLTWKKGDGRVSDWGYEPDEMESWVLIKAGNDWVLRT